MKCQFCNAVITQNEADEAHYIFDSGETLCPACATRMRKDKADTRKIKIFRDGVYSGNGRLVDGKIVDCDAGLGSEPGETDDIFEAIEDAIENEIDFVFWESSAAAPDAGFTFRWEIE